MQFTVKNDSRIDVAIVAELPGASRSYVSILCDQGKVTHNGKKIFKASTKVHVGDTVHVELDNANVTAIPEINLDVLYEDQDCIVVNKPAGVLTHSKGTFNPEATVSTFIRPKTTGMQDNRGGIVHRLDRVTSGVLICAKHEEALKWLQKQFADRKVKKTYIAIVDGMFDQPNAIIDMPIERNPKKPQTFRVGPNGKPAVTQYRVVAHTDSYSMVELSPTTGRTHQLRVHMAQIGHPILGDILYGGAPAKRTYLHAVSLNLELPSHKMHTFTAPLPKAFHDIVKK